MKSQIEANIQNLKRLKALTDDPDLTLLYDMALTTEEMILESIELLNQRLNLIQRDAARGIRLLVVGRVEVSNGDTACAAAAHANRITALLKLRELYSHILQR